MEPNALKVPATAGLKSIAPLTNPIIISDLHLTNLKPKTVARFMSFMQTEAPRYQELVILGDLFDFWLGDDGMLNDAQPIVSLLRLYASTGRRVIVMPGNRDVMLGEDFAKAAGAELVTDPIVVEIKGRRVLLAHGDQWCLRDEAYQAFRRQTHDPHWQAAMLSKSVAERLEIARHARAQSEYDKSQKADEIMDVVEEEVAKDAQAAGVNIVIHGHTHKPSAHIAGTFERWVIPDWELDDIEEGQSGRCGAITFLEDGRAQIQMF